MKQFISKKVQCHVVNWQLGYRCEHIVQAELEEEFCQCPECDKQFSRERALKMHCKRMHGKRPEARKYVLGPMCPLCSRDFITRPRVIGHFTRGALACTLPWRLGLSPEFPQDLVDVADLFDKEQRRAANNTGALPGVGICCR